MNIQLEGDYKISDNRVWLLHDGIEACYTLPSRRPRITLFHMGKRAQLTIGGFKTVTVSVTGPVEDVKKLRDAVL